MISVAMAAYNGEKYIKAQIDSILSQIGREDELVVSDDGSCDATCAIIESIAGGDSRIKLIRNRGKGVILNFENALLHCRGDIIFLSDQDDIWLPGKVETVSRAIQSGANLVLTDAIVADENLKPINDSFYGFNKSKKGIMNNLLHNSFHGCTMAFDSRIKDIALPISKRVPMHDIWLGHLAMLFGKVCYLPEKLVIYRRHEKNATGYEKSPIWQKFWWRACIVFPVATRAIKLMLTGTGAHRPRLFA